MEEFKDIPGYEGIYQVSNLGNVVSLKRMSDNGRGYYRPVGGIVLKKSISVDGYHGVNLWKDSKKKSLKVHQLVAMAFLGHERCGLKFQINHINFIRTDNRLENLEIVTARENSSHKQGKYSSKYTGVFWHKNLNKWMSQINIRGKSKYLGYFETELEAHNAYQKELNIINQLKS